MQTAYDYEGVETVEKIDLGFFLVDSIYFQLLIGEDGKSAEYTIARIVESRLRSPRLTNIYIYI